MLDEEGWHLVKGGFGNGYLLEVQNWLQGAIGRAKIDPTLEAQFEENYVDSMKPVRKLRRLLWNDIPFWSRILEQSGIFDLARRFVPGDPVIIHHAAFLKSKHVGTETGFHQDQGLWDHEYPNAINIWIALSDCNSANGCIQIFPRSHHLGLLPHIKTPEYPWHPVVDVNRLESKIPYDVSMPAGDVLVWHRYMVHGSGPNRSNQDRFGMVLVCADASQIGFETKDVYRISKVSK